jgi:hypothetical protein
MTPAARPAAVVGLLADAVGCTGATVGYEDHPYGPTAKDVSKV